MLVLNLDHVAVAVRDLDASLAVFRRLYGLDPASRRVMVEEGWEQAVILVGGSRVELLAPTGPDTPVGRFLAERGEGLHHLALAVADLDAALAHLAEEGEDAVDRAPRADAEGRRTALVRTRALGGVMCELVEIT